MACDFIALVLQAIGGGVPYSADPGTSIRDAGKNIMVVGLVFQAFCITIFQGLAVDFLLRVRKHGADEALAARRAVRSRPIFFVFLASILLATLLIIIRSAYRAAELWEGFSGDLWNDELDFMILDGAMVSLAVILLSVFHPGPAFREQWLAADWSIRRKKKTCGSYTASGVELEKTHELVPMSLIDTSKGGSKYSTDA